MIDGVEADKYPERLSWLKQQEEKSKLLQEEREAREKLKSKGESDGENNEGSSIL